MGPPRQSRGCEIESQLVDIRGSCRRRAPLEKSAPGAHLKMVATPFPHGKRPSGRRIGVPRERALKGAHSKQPVAGACPPSLRRFFLLHLTPPWGGGQKMRSIFRVGVSRRYTGPHPKSLRCATRFRPPHKGEVNSSLRRRLLRR